MECELSMPPIEQIFGLVRCHILPPRDLRIGVLPYRAKERLMFPLCASCADGLQQGPNCGHTEHERMLAGTWVSEEIKLALEMGYRLIRKFPPLLRQRDER